MDWTVWEHCFYQCCGSCHYLLIKSTLRCWMSFRSALSTRRNYLSDDTSNSFISHVLVRTAKELYDASYSSVYLRGQPFSQVIRLIHLYVRGQPFCQVIREIHLLVYVEEHFARWNVLIHLFDVLGGSVCQMMRPIHLSKNMENHFAWWIRLIHLLVYVEELFAWWYVLYISFHSFCLVMRPHLLHVLWETFSQVIRPTYQFHVREGTSSPVMPFYSSVSLIQRNVLPSDILLSFLYLIFWCGCDIVQKMYSYIFKMMTIYWRFLDCVILL